MSKDANQTAPGTGDHPEHYLTEWREFRGLSQRELAEMLNVSNSKISRIESGETEFKASFIKKVARFFNIPAMALLTINPQGEGAQTAQMLTAWGNLTARQRADMLRMMSALSNDNGDAKAG